MWLGRGELVIEDMFAIVDVIAVTVGDSGRMYGIWNIRDGIGLGSAHNCQ